MVPFSTKKCLFQGESMKNDEVEMFMPTVKPVISISGELRDYCDKEIAKLAIPHEYFCVNGRSYDLSKLKQGTNKKT